MQPGVLVTLALALCVGTAVGYYGANNDISLKSPNEDLATRPAASHPALDVMLLTEKDAQQQRADHYASVSNLADVLSLPTQFARVEALVALTARFNVNALTELVDATRALPDDTGHRQLSSITLLRLVELEPELALDYLRSSKLQGTESQLVGDLFSAWSKTDLNAALRGTRKLKDTQQMQIAGDAILQAWQHHGEELAQSIVKQLPAKFSAARHEMTELLQLAASAPAEAFGRTLEIKDPQQRFMTVNSVLDIWARQDISTAANYVLRLDDDQLGKSLLYSITQRYAQQQPAKALEWIETSIKGQQRDSMLQMAIGKIAEQDPARAIAYLEKLPSAQRQPNMIVTVAASWAGKDPEAALDWIARQNPAHANNALRAVARVWAGKDPEAASQYLESLPVDARDAWLSSVAGVYAQQQPAEALAWLQQYNTEPAYPNALTRILNQWAHTDPRAVLDYVERQPADEKFSSVAANSMARLAREDPAAAAALVEAMPESSIKQAAAAALGAQWALEDVRALDDWAATLDAGPSRDRVIATLAPRLDDEPERAISLINSIQSEQSRLNAAMQLLAARAQEDGQQPLELLERLDISEARRQQLNDTLRSKHAAQQARSAVVKAGQRIKIPWVTASGFDK